MSTSFDRRRARRNKHIRTHHWDAHIEVAYLIARAEDESDELAPRPSQQVPTSGHRVPYPAKGRPNTTRDRYVYDTGE